MSNKLGRYEYIASKSGPEAAVRSLMESMRPTNVTANDMNLVKKLIDEPGVNLDALTSVANSRGHTEIAKLIRDRQVKREVRGMVEVGQQKGLPGDMMAKYTEYLTGPRPKKKKGGKTRKTKHRRRVTRRRV